MTDLELITSPIKKIGAKIGLLSSDPNDPNKKQGIQWKEYNGLTWGQFAKTEKEEGEIIDRTWKLAQYRDTGSIFPSVHNEIECDIIKMSLKIDASSNIRRVGTLTVHMKDESYIESEFEEAWFNKLIRITIFFLMRQQIKIGSLTLVAILSRMDSILLMLKKNSFSQHFQI